MQESSYKLSCFLLGHKEDVRALATFDDGTIVSASRDKTSRVWVPNSSGEGYCEKSVLSGHDKFVVSVCVLNPSENFPKGHIITGSNDCYICIYESDKTEPIHKFKAHQNTVCCLKASHEEGQFLSSSWDLSASLWSLCDTKKALVTFLSHSSAVWSILDLPSKLVVTGSADKLIIVWQRDGSIMHKLEGHTDCVRDLAVAGDQEFLSCSNDAIVRRWNAVLGECLEMYTGHSNYIYSIDLGMGGSVFATSSEDYCVKVWKSEDSVETIYLPTQSVWCVKFLKNGDIVTGANDGVIRIFTKNPDRVASEQLLTSYEENVKSVRNEAQSKIGGVDINSLKDTSALKIPGKNDGDVKMVREGKSAVVYSWSQSKKVWEKIGDVMGGSGGSQSTSGKQLYNGIEYDYVFSVDIEDGAPPLKLPYNSGQDPWVVAQKFIEDNQLSQLFLDQVANFIVKNSTATPILNTNSGFADPFTGGNRYVPTSESSSSVPAKPVRVDYIPQKSYLKLEQANVSAIFEKLREFNKEHGEIPEEKLKILEKLTENLLDNSMKLEAIGVLKLLLGWPKNHVFPALDVARLLVLRKEANEELCKSELVLNLVKQYLVSDTCPANQMLTLRFLANMFVCEKGESLGLETKEEVLQVLSNSSLNLTKAIQIAASTYIINLVVALNSRHDDAEKVKVMEVILKLLNHLNDQEAVFRILVAMGSLLSETKDELEMKRLIDVIHESEFTLRILRESSEKQTHHFAQKKLADCSKHIIDMIM